MEPHPNDNLAIRARLDALRDGLEITLLRYCRLFNFGFPISGFYCRVCRNYLGHTVPLKCDTCRPLFENLGFVERRVIGFTRLADELWVGKYEVMAIVLA